jgi:CRP/FNR family transcriptional regulator, dissimilatory nitrate respiration regulator
MIAIMSEPLTNRLKMLSKRSIHLDAREPLFRAGDPVSMLFLVAEGTVHLERPTPAGARLILQRAKAGDIVAEASCFSSHYHCDAVAAEPSRLFCIGLQAFMEACRREPGLQSAFAAHLAHRVQDARMRAEILAIKTVAGRLDAWLALTGSTLPNKGRWRELADALAVSPEALYREIARRRRKHSAGGETSEEAHPKREWT